MSRYWRNLEDELIEAVKAKAEEDRAVEVADLFDHGRVGRLINNFLEDPTIPIDLQLSLVDEAKPTRAAVAAAAAQSDAAPPEEESFWSQGMDRLGGGFENAYDLTKYQAQTVSPLLEYQPQMLQAGFRNVAGVAQDPSKLKSLGIRSALQMVQGGSPLPGQSLVDPNASLLSDLTVDQDSLIERLNEVDSNGERNPGSTFSRLLSGTSFGETDLGQITRELAETGGVDRSDWGDGFFISNESALMQRRTQEMRRHGASETGGVITVGNWTADQSGFIPGSAPYRALATTIDLGIEITQGGAIDDMLDIGVRHIGRGAINNRLLQGTSRGDFLRQAGAHAGRYETADLPAALNYLNSDTGTAVAEWFAKTDSVSDVFRRTRGQYSPETLVRLADAKDADEVKSVLLNAFGATGAAPEFRSLPGNWLHQRTAGFRLFGESPQGHIDFSDHAQSVGWVDQAGQTLGMSDETRAVWIERMARASDPGLRYHAYADSIADVESRLIADFSEGGLRVNPERASALTQFQRADVDTAKIAIDDMIGMQETNWSTLTVAGSEHKMPSAHLLAERAEVLPTPNMRDLRRVTGSQRLLFEAIEVGSDMSTATQNLVRLSNAVLPSWSPGTARKLKGVPRVGDFAEFGLEAIESFQKVWKISRLVRFAFPIRVVGIEEAARLDAAGHPSLWNHQISFFSDMLNSSKMTDLSGELLEGTDDWIAARAGATGRQPMHATELKPVHKTAEGSAEIWTPTEGFSKVTAREKYIHAWKQQLEKLGNDRVVQLVTRADTSSDALVELMSTKYGRDTIEEIRNMHPGLIRSDRDMIAYLDSVRRRVASTTGSNTNLLQYLKGSDARKGSWIEEGVLDDLVDDYGPDVLAYSEHLSRDSRSLMDRAVGHVFEFLASRPTNVFSRSPVFRDSYRQALVEMSPLTNDPEGLLRMAEGSGVFHGANADGLNILRAQTHAAPWAEMTPEMLDAFAKKKALDDVQGLLYDLTRSNEFFQTYQTIFPFGEAWKEGVTTWFRLIKDHPFRVQRRVLAYGEAASDAGVFHENQYGDTVFSIPGSRALMGADTLATPGVPFDLEATGKGLNMLGEGTPGAGPFAQISAAYMIPDEPSWDWVREIVMPFGDPETPRDAASWAIPAFARRMWIGLNGPFTPRENDLFGNTMFSIQQYMLSTGEHTTNTEEGITKLVEESRVAAAKLFFIRGGVQAVSPSSPLVKPNVLGPDGELVTTKAVTDRYYDLLEADPDTALEKLIAEVGMQNILAIGKNTLATVHGGIPMAGDGYDWVRENPDVIDNHRQLFGFFAPQNPTGEFNSEAYNRAKEEGLIEQLTPREKLYLVNHRIASTIYRNSRKKLYARIEASGRKGPNEEEAQWLREVKERLTDEWPGYATADTIGKLPPVLKVIDSGDIERALEDPVLADTPAGQGLAEYWAYRQQVIDVADGADVLTTLNGQDGGWRKTDDMLEQRLWLIRKGDEIAAANPDFLEMWDSLLSRELRHDGTE